MFEARRERHRKIVQVLSLIDAPLFAQSQCYFGGGTAVALLLSEFRESVDIDFMVTREGYANLRSRVDQGSMDRLFATRHPDVRLPADVRIDRDAIRARIEVGGERMKFEIIRAGNTEIEGEETQLPVMTMTRSSLVAEKLLANCDRWLDRSFMSKDVVDLCMMKLEWGFPAEALAIAERSYGIDPIEHFDRARKALVADPKYFVSVMEALKVDPVSRLKIQACCRARPKASRTAGKTP